MKLKKNEIAVFRIRDFDNFYHGKIHYLYFTDNDDCLKTLRSNSKYLDFWDGNNWKQIEIEYVEKINFVNYENTTGKPAFSFSRSYELKNGNVLNLVTSNTSGSITPYWKEECMF